MKENLIRRLQKVQETEGYVSDLSIVQVATHFGISPVEVEGVLTFYTQFKRKKPGRYQIAVCDGTACHIKGSILVLTWVEDALGIKDGDTDPEGIFSLETVACLGCCSLAPVISINHKIYGNLDRKTLMKILKAYQKEAKNG